MLLIGLVVCFGILVITIFEKFYEGGWVTLVITSVFIGLGLFIKHLYRNFRLRLLQNELQFCNYENIAPTIQPPSATREKKNIRRLTVEDEHGCMEVTPDGVVRTFATCGGELVDANRIADPKFLLKLLDAVSVMDTTPYRVRPKTGVVITLHIQTDTENITVYLPASSPSPSYDPGTIEGLIHLVQGDLPQPTQTPVPGGPSVTPTATTIPISGTPSPTPTLAPWITPTVTPEASNLTPFTCGFSEDESGKKPLNVSNYICSTQPSPAP
jgi:hypothetical protein